MRAGLLREDLFVAVHEHFMTDTAQLADIVLPATMFLEHDDIYGAGGHSHIQLGPKVLEPAGEARSNHDVLSALAYWLGAVHAGFEDDARGLADATLKRSGWSGIDELVTHRWIDAQPDFRVSHFLDGFGHPGGRFRFAPDWVALGPYSLGMPALPDQWEMTKAVDAAHPFRLVAPPARQFLNTSFSNVVESRRREGKPSVMMHPRDASTLGVVDGNQVTLGNQRGQVRLPVRIAAGQQEKVVVVEGIWPHADFVLGRGINALIGDTPAAPNGGAVFHDTAVWVLPA